MNTERIENALEVIREECRTECNGCPLGNACSYFKMYAYEFAELALENLREREVNMK